MAFHKNRIWARHAGCLPDGEKVLDNSPQQKRGQQWIMDATEQELFSKKKKAVDAVNRWNVFGISNMNDSSRGSISGLGSVSGPVIGHPFGADLTMTHALSRIISSGSSGNMDMGRKGFEYPFRTDSSFDSSTLHALGDPSFNYSGIRKVKVNDMRDSDNGMSKGMGHFRNREAYNMISAGSAAYNKSDYSNISLGPIYNNGNKNSISIGASSNQTTNFGSTSHTLNQETGNSIPVGHNHYKGDGIELSMGNCYHMRNRNFLSKVQLYAKGDGNIMSMDSAYNKWHEKFISMGLSYGEPNGNFSTMDMVYSKQNEDIISRGPNDKVDMGNVSLCLTYDREDSSLLSMGYNCNKGQKYAVSFGDFQEEPKRNFSGRINNSYDLLMSQSSAQAPEAVCRNARAVEILGPIDVQISQVLAQKDAQLVGRQGQEVQPSKQVLSQILLGHSNSDPPVDFTPNSTSKTTIASKNKQTHKKDPSGHFPLNVKSLLSTGIFDGVPVKYISWTREKSVRGVIKGSGYLCSCKDCSGSNCLNAYEFERHASCKTKHPNNHIYFENGKTIYAVVQELKSTPQDKLCEVIQHVTGSPINQQNFRTWKASFQVARVVYGKDGAASASKVLNAGINQTCGKHTPL